MRMSEEEKRGMPHSTRHVHTYKTSLTNLLIHLKLVLPKPGTQEVRHLHPSMQAAS